MWSRRAGEMKVLDARTFINSSLDADADAEPLDVPTVYAVHCTADFNAKRPWSECNHWVPGWHVEDLGMDRARQLHREWMSLQQRLHEDAMLDLHEQEMNAVMDPDLQAALRNDLQICEDRSMRFELMSHKLFLEHGIIFHDVVADGNCGIETVACWERVPEIWQTPDGDMKRLREELQSAWLSSIEVPYWRGVFLHYLSGVALPRAPPPPADNQPETSEAAELEVTPQSATASATALLLQTLWRNVLSCFQMNKMRNVVSWWCREKMVSRLRRRGVLENPNPSIQRWTSRPTFSNGCRARESFTKPGWLSTRSALW